MTTTMELQWKALKSVTALSSPEQEADRTEVNGASLPSFV
jgi:hypothetical protein